MAAEVEALQKIEVDEGLPDSEVDGESMGLRGGRYGESYVLNLVPTTHMLSREGTYFVATNPTPGTAFAANIQAAFSDTVPFIYLFNQESQQNVRAKYCYIHYIKIIVSVVPVTATAAQIALITDIVSRGLGTDNMTQIQPVSTTTSMTLPSDMFIKAQSSGTASAITASSQQKRVLARASFPSGLPTIGDELVLVCGETGLGGAQGLTAAQATCPGRKVCSAPPVVVAPGHSLTAHLWFPGNATTGLSYEVEIAGWLR